MFPPLKLVSDVYSCRVVILSPNVGFRLIKLNRARNVLLTSMYNTLPTLHKLPFSVCPGADQCACVIHGL